MGVKRPGTAEEAAHRSRHLELREVRADEVELRLKNVHRSPRPRSAALICTNGPPRRLQVGEGGVVEDLIVVDAHRQLAAIEERARPTNPLESSQERDEKPPLDVAPREAFLEADEDAAAVRRMVRGREPAAGDGREITSSSFSACGTVLDFAR